MLAEVVDIFLRHSRTAIFTPDFEWAAALRPDVASYDFVSHFPGSKLFDLAKQDSVPLCTKSQEEGPAARTVEARRVGPSSRSLN